MHKPLSSMPPDSSSRSSSPNKSPKSARRHAREFALQGFYQWQLSNSSGADIEKFLGENNKSFSRADTRFFKEIFYGVLREAESLQISLEPHLDRKMAALSPIERGILLLGAFELIYHLDTHHAVILNEAIELAKTFGGTDGHRYVNGVLDKLALLVRPDEPRKQIRAGK